MEYILNIEGTILTIKQFDVGIKLKHRVVITCSEPDMIMIDGDEDEDDSDNVNELIVYKNSVVPNQEDCEINYNNAIESGFTPAEARVIGWMTFNTFDFDSEAHRQVVDIVIISILFNKTNWIKGHKLTIKNNKLIVGSLRLNLPNTGSEIAEFNFRELMK
jgi:hypothetical protein